MREIEYLTQNEYGEDFSTRAAGTSSERNDVLKRGA